MLLSDRDIVAEVEAGRLGVAPFAAELIQPSSVDVRLDRYFRVFNNQKYTHIDPSTRQDELTSLSEVDDGEPFVLHPGEFVLASTLEVVTLPDDLAGRLEGKALCVDTPIPTPQGPRTMGDLRVGQQIFDENGDPCTILRTSPIMYGRECRTVRFCDGSTIVADADHLWMTQTEDDRRQGRTGAVRTTAQIAASLTGPDGAAGHRVALPGAVKYPTRRLAVDPYALGAWLAVGTGTELFVGDRRDGLVAEIEAAGYPMVPVSQPGGAARRDTPEGAVRTREGCGTYRVAVELADRLRAMGLLDDKRIPDAYRFADHRQRSALLQGLMDAAGHVDDDGYCRFTTSNEALRGDVVELAAGLGLRPVESRDVAGFQVALAPGSTVFRSVDAAPTRTPDRFRTIVAVEPAVSRPVRCIEVSTANGMFLAGTRHIPTHNSSLGRLGLLTHSTAGFIDPGFSGHVTLELSNVANLPITLWPGMKIGQLCLFRLSSPAQHPYGSSVYGSRYQGQRGPTPSRSWQNWRVAPTKPVTE